MYDQEVPVGQGRKMTVRWTNNSATGIGCLKVLCCPFVTLDLNEMYYVRSFDHHVWCI